ncbi:MAG: hypothetical protein AABZ55_07580 [Bdellovibrionota bacterium]
MSMSVTSVTSYLGSQNAGILTSITRSIGRANSSDANYWKGSGGAVRAYQDAMNTGSPLSVPNGHSHSHSMTNIEAVKRMVF